MNSFFLGGRLDSGKQQVALSYLVSGWDPLNSVTLEPLSFFFLRLLGQLNLNSLGKNKRSRNGSRKRKFSSASKSRSDWNVPARNKTKAPFLNFLSLFCTQLHSKLGIHFFREFYKGAFPLGTCSRHWDHRIHWGSIVRWPIMWIVKAGKFGVGSKIVMFFKTVQDYWNGSADGSLGDTGCSSPVSLKSIQLCFTSWSFVGNIYYIFQWCTLNRTHKSRN